MDYEPEQLREGNFFIQPDWRDCGDTEHPYSGCELIGPFPNQMEAIEWHCNNLPLEVSEAITEIEEAMEPVKKENDNE